MRLDELESAGGNIGNPAASRVLQQQQAEGAAVVLLKQASCRCGA